VALVRALFRVSRELTTQRCTVTSIEIGSTFPVGSSISVGTVVYRLLPKMHQSIVGLSPQSVLVRLLRPRRLRSQWLTYLTAWTKLKLAVRAPLQLYNEFVIFGDG
jgi:hypothetical protein